MSMPPHAESSPMVAGQRHPEGDVIAREEMKYPAQERYPREERYAPQARYPQEERYPPQERYSPQGRYPQQESYQRGPPPPHREYSKPMNSLVITCRDCGQESDADGFFCQYCGSPMPEDPTRMSRANPSYGNNYTDRAPYNESNRWGSHEQVAFQPENPQYHQDLRNDRYAGAQYRVRPEDQYAEEYRPPQAREQRSQHSKPEPVPEPSPAQSNQSGVDDKEILRKRDTDILNSRTRRGRNNLSNDLQKDYVRDLSVKAKAGEHVFEQFTRANYRRGNKIGRLPVDVRIARIKRYLHKRKNRNWNKKIRYGVRRAVATDRPRVGGRFVKHTKLEVKELAQEASNLRKQLKPVLQGYIQKRLQKRAGPRKTKA